MPQPTLQSFTPQYPTYPSPNAPPGQFSTAAGQSWFDPVQPSFLPPPSNPFALPPHVNIPNNVPLPQPNNPSLFPVLPNLPHNPAPNMPSNIPNPERIPPNIPRPVVITFI